MTTLLLPIRPASKCAGDLNGIWVDVREAVRHGGGATEEEQVQIEWEASGDFPHTLCITLAVPQYRSMDVAFDYLIMCSSSHDITTRANVNEPC